MRWTTSLGLGILLGMQHALEADHLAAVAALLGREGRPGRALARGAAWGVGHSATLLMMVGACLAVGIEVPEALSRQSETIVALILAALGCGVIWRLRYGVQQHDAPGRALLVGMAHGMSGSAALLVLMLHGGDDLMRSLLFVTVFGLGSIVGMAALSLLIAWPLRAVATRENLQRLLVGVFGGASVSLPRSLDVLRPRGLTPEDGSPSDSVSVV